MRIFASTPLYVQGPGIMDRAGEILCRFGTAPGIVIDPIVRPLVGPALERGISAPLRIEEFADEVTDANIAAIAGRMRDCDVIVGVGGGKALDAGKAVALRLGVTAISVPTIASTDGPASRGIAMYDESHRLIRVDQMPANPAAVIVDSAVIAGAPARFLRAGVGDAIAKKFEAEGCWAGGGLTKHGTRPTHSALAIADAAYRMLRAHAVAGVIAAERHEVTEDLEATIEAAVLLSALGFENGGLSIAHSVTRGLMTLRGAKDRLHGEHVAYGTLVHLAVDERPLAEIADLADFLRAVGLPASLAELGVEQVSGEEVTGIATAIMGSPHISKIGRTVTSKGLEAAIRLVEALDRP